MKHRDPVVTLLLALFVPFYVIYWFYVTAQAVRSRNIHMPGNFWLFGPYIMLLGGWFLYIPLAIMGGAAGANNAGTFNVITALLGLLVFAGYIGGYVLMILYYYNFSKGVVQVIGNDMSPGIYTLIMAFIPAVPVYLMQEKLNMVYQQEMYYQQAPPQAQPYYQAPPSASPDPYSVPTPPPTAPEPSAPPEQPAVPAEPPASPNPSDSSES